MRHLSVSILVSLTFAGAAAALPIRHDVDAEAYHGDPADFPALFSLFETDAGAPDCLATLIAPGWAITARHCAVELPANLDEVFYAVELAGVRGRITAVTMPPGDENEIGNDFALLRIDGVPDGVTPVPIYRHDDEAGRTVILPGWGDTGTGLTGVTGGDGVFRVAENRVEIADGFLLIWTFDDPRSRTLNALALEGISGAGDSGGPALVHTPQGVFVAGVSSSQRTFGRQAGSYGVEEYYVRVSAHADWIDGVIASAED